MDAVRTLTHHCLDGVCYCDWRLTIYGCVNSYGLKIIYITMIVVSGVASLLCFSVFFYRYFFKGHQLFVLNSTSLLRPKPIDCLMFFLAVFNSLRMLSGLILVTDVSQTNVLARSFMFEFPWQWGYGACCLYFLGIAQTLADSHKKSARQWLPSARSVDCIGLTLLCMPFIVNNICSIAAGVLGSSSTATAVYKAELFTRLLYGFWFYHCGVLASAILYTGLRLLALLRTHLKKMKSHEQVVNVKAGMFKIRGLVAVLFVAVGGFAVFLLFYGILRNQIIQSVPGSYVLCTLWNFLGPLASFLACLAVLLNPRIDEKPMIGLPNSSTGGNTSSNQTSGNIYTTHDSSDLHQTLSANAYDTFQKIKDDMSGQYAMSHFDNHHHSHHLRYGDEEEEESFSHNVDLPLRSSKSNLISPPSRVH